MSNPDYDKAFEDGDQFRRDVSKALEGKSPDEKNHYLAELDAWVAATNS